MSLPPDLAVFITETIDTVAELEALLLMRREHEQPWTIARLAARLYIDEPATGRVVEGLARKQFIRPTEAGYRFDPQDEGDRERIARLAGLYAQMLIPITRLVHAKPSPGLRDFADAFRLREKKP